jgi:hypothetical protein
MISGQSAGRASISRIIRRHSEVKLWGGNEKISANRTMDGEPFIDNHQGQLD